MARSCSVCKKGLGTFDKPHTLTQEDGRAYLLCGECGEKLRYAGLSDVDPANRTVISYRDQALNFFAERLATGSLEAAVAAELNALPGMADRRAQAEAEKAKVQENERRYLEEREGVLVTTGFDFQGHRVTAYHKVISADAIIGTGLLAETAAAVADLVGEKSGTLGRKVAQAKERAYADMLKQAILVGGNAVLGVSYDVYVVGSMLGASVTGTSVTVVPDLKNG